MKTAVDQVTSTFPVADFAPLCRRTHRPRDKNMLNSYVTFDPFMPIDPNMRQYRGAASSLVLGTFEPLGQKEGELYARVRQNMTGD